MKKYSVLFEAVLVFLIAGIFQYAAFIVGIRFVIDNFSLTWVSFYEVSTTFISGLIALFTAIWLWKLKFKWNFQIPSKSIWGLATLMLILEFVVGDILLFSTFFERLSDGKILFYGFDFHNSQLYHLNGIYFLFAIFIGPIIEEFFFRGILFRKFRTVLPLWSSIVFSSVFFALVHLNLDGFLYYFLGGCILAYIFYRTNSLVLVTIYHMGFNLLTFLVPRREFNTSDNQFPLILLFFFVCSAGLYATLKHFYTITTPVEEDSSPLDPREDE